jgi:hypothetical protein
MINVSKLHKEIVAAGLPVISVDSHGNITLAEDATSQQLAQAQSILAAHDPTDYVAQDAETARLAIRAKYVETVNDLQAALDNWASLTVAQQKAVLKRLAEAMLFLLKYLRTNWDY